MNRPVRRADSRPERIKVARQELVVARGRLEKARYLNPFNPAIEGGGEVPKLEATWPRSATARRGKSPSPPTAIGKTHDHDRRSRRPARDHRRRPRVFSRARH